jgi:hypothetical protein
VSACRDELRGEGGRVVSVDWDELRGEGGRVVSAPRRDRLRSVWLAGAVLVVFLVAAVSASAATIDTTGLISKSVSGGMPNGPSRNASFSQDRQIASMVAFESDASDLVSGDGNGNVTDIFVVKRANAGSDGLRGLPWDASAPQLVTHGVGGGPANGPSTLPSVDGDQNHDGLSGRPRPHCVGYISSASNLVSGDTNNQPDAFVTDLNSGKTVRVSVNALGQQANGATTDVQIDGACRRVGFTSDATNLALTKSTWKRAGSPPEWKPVVTTPSDPGVKQAYVRVLRVRTDGKPSPKDEAMAGATFLASANEHHVAGNGPSYDVSITKSDGCPVECDGTSGVGVAFTSEATNLASNDTNGVPDVYRRLFIAGREKSGVKRPKKAPFTPWGPPTITANLVSVTPGGGPGDGGSTQPSIDARGRYVAFTTAATNILPCQQLPAGQVCDNNGVSDIVWRDYGGRKARTLWASASGAIGQPGNGPSSNPSITRYGSIFFQSDATNLQPQPFGTRGPVDRNQTGDVFYWSEQFKNVTLYSEDSDDVVHGNPVGNAARPGVVTAPALNPSTSAYNNYVAFESGDPMLDLSVGGPLFGGDRDAAARAANSVAALHQVYVRYVGPR